MDSDEVMVRIPLIDVQRIGAALGTLARFQQDSGRHDDATKVEELQERSDAYYKAAVEEARQKK